MPSASAPARILLIDNDADMRELAARLLHREVPAAVTPVEGETELALALELGEFDAVVTDYELGWTDGLTLCSRIKAAHPDCPVVLFTGSGSEEVAVRALHAGVDDYVLKSHGLAARLPAAVRAVLRRVEERRARQRAEAELRESERRYRALAENSGIGIWQITPKGDTLYANQALLRMLEVESPEELSGVDYFDFFTPESAGVVRREQRLRQAGIASSFEVEVLGKNGARRRVLVHGAPIMSPEGELQSLIGTFTDVTARHHAEQAAVRSETRFRKMLESNPIGVFFARTDGRITQANPALLELFGYGLADVGAGALNLERLAPPDARPRLAEALEQLRREGAASPRELELLSRDGRRLPVLLGYSALETEEEQFVGFVVDLSERRRLERQLQQSQKMEAVGRLAGGVAHDFNNMLAVINGYADLLLGRRELEPDLRTSVREIRQAGERAASLTRQLLAFSRRQVPTPQVLDVNDIVRAMSGMVRRLIGEDIRVETVTSPEPQPIRADAGQIEQVVLNLAVNARDAMPGGGTVRIETREVRLTAPNPREHPGIPPGTYTLLCVTDTGFGMDEEVLSHLFEPFYTTKQPGQGTGLGLAIVYAVVQQNGGYIHVESQPGRGTAFGIYLPRSREAVAELPPHETFHGVTGGTETILLVEDEPQVRQLTQTVLEAAGYAVLEAADPSTALRICQEIPEAIQLLLTDVVMPGMSGAELADRVAAIRPEIRVVYMSGYTGDAILYRGVSQASQAFLQKPFSPTALLRIVREVLDRHGDAGTP